MPSVSLPSLSSLPPEYITEYCGDVLRNLAIAFIILEIFFVSLRFLSKRIGRNAYGTDDWLVLASLVMCVVLNITEFLFIDTAGLGRHQIVIAQTAPHKLVNFGKLCVIVPIMYLAATSLPRIAILVFYLRIFTFGFQRTATIVIIWIVIAYAIAGTIASLTQCIPLAYTWDKSLHGHCFDTTAYYRYGMLPNTITDVFMLLLPLPAVWSLYASVRTKIGLVVTLLTGSVGLIASILRTVEFFKTNGYHKGILDRTWTSGGHNIWAVVEPGCYLIAACLVTLRPLLRSIFGTSPDGWVFKKRRNTTNMSIQLPIQLAEMPIQPQDTYRFARVRDIDDQETLVRR